MNLKYFQKDIECMPNEELKKLQGERLVKQFRRVYENVEFYRNRCKEAGVTPDDIKGLEDLHKIPFTSKDDLRATYPYGLFAVPMKDVVRLHASSGTTGKSIVVGYTQNDLGIWDDCCARQLTAIGIGQDDFVQNAYGYGMFTGGFGLHGGATKIGATVIPVSAGNTPRQLTFMQDFGSTLLCCTPSYAAYLGESLKDAGLSPDDIKLKAGIFGAAPWPEEMRRDIAKSLGIKAYDVYGLTEVLGPGVAFECSEQAGMHVNEDHFIIEIIDPETGKQVPDGQKGELVFTTITKEAFPLLRFRTKDICMVNSELCKCGRTFVRMAKPMGRTDDMLIIRGVNVFPSQVETVLLQNGYPPNYQIIVGRENNNDTFEIKVEMVPEKFSDVVAEINKEEKALEAALLTVLQIKAKVKLVAPKSIARSEGKAKRVIDTRKLI